MNTIESIQNRKTLKLRVDPENPLPITKGEDFKTVMEELVTLAGKAPFHYQSAQHHRLHKISGAEPWRFHALDTKACRRLLDAFNRDEPMKASDGIKQMLAAADGLILGTWLPEKSRSKSRKFYPNVKNMEHIAAAGAAIQNILLAATDIGITNYWSSGGSIRKAKVMDYLGIPKEEILLGAIFLFPDEYPESVQTKTGKNREVKGSLKDFFEWVEL